MGEGSGFAGRWAAGRVPAVVMVGLLLVPAIGCVPGVTDTGNQNVNDNQPDDGTPPPLGVELAIAHEGAAHVPVGTPVTYVANPPASGAHWSALGIAPTASGFYEEEVEAERWVHNLEHGHVVLLYDCGQGCPAGLLDELSDFFTTVPPSPIFNNRKLVIAPYDGLPYLLILIAWDIQMHLDAFDPDVVLDFYERHLDQGPELAP